jgi:glycosyltransferase involved in cell wall biosynthesis
MNLVPEPQLSIIVVAYNVSAYLRQCLESCAIVLPGELEIIIVVNKSDDSTLAVAEDYVRIHGGNTQLKALETNIGLGPARNLGLQSASGDYVTFLDGDDWYEPNAAQHIAEALANPDFDVCMFSHNWVYPDGTVRPNDRLSRTAKGLITSAEDRRPIFDNLGTAWNRILRRTFLDENRIAFEDGYYEDITWHFRVLIQAKTIRVLDRPLINYRQREGSIRHSIDQRHFDVFRRYSTLLQWIKDDPSIARNFGDKIYAYCASNISAALRNRRLPSNDEVRYMQEGRAMLAELRRTALPTSGIKGFNSISWREALLWLGRPKLWRSIDSVRRKI